MLPLKCHIRLNDEVEEESEEKEDNPPSMQGVISTPTPEKKKIKERVD